METNAASENSRAGAHADNERKYRLGLALSGGGARGLAHAGALKALEEAGLRPDVLAGVSAGSLIAVLYAAGVSPDGILDLFTHARFSDLSEIKIGKGGIMRIDRCGRFIENNIKGYKRLEELPIPTYVGVTDFEEGTPVEFHKGEIRPIITASCSIPIAIRPVTIEGRTYVDGGVLRNLPAWIIRDRCERLIGVNVSPLVNNGAVKHSFFGMALRTYELLAKSNQYHDMELCDLLVQTRHVANHRVFSLKGLDKVFDDGYREMKSALERAQWTNNKTDS